MVYYIKSNNVSSLVSGTLSASATTLNITAGEGSDFPSTFPFLLTIWAGVNPSSDTGMEIVRCTGRTIDALTIVRAQEGTADVEHSSGENVAMLTTAGLFNDATYGVEGNIDTYSYQNSPLIVTGGAISEGTNVGTFKVAALTAALRNTDSVTGDLIYVTLAEQDNQAITVANTNYIIALNYNDGSPTISIGVSNPYSADKRNIPIGRVMKDSSNNVHYISGGYDFQDGIRKLHTRIKLLRNIELGSGNIIAYSGTNNFTMTSGAMYSGVNSYLTSSYDSASNTFIPVYGDGVGGFTEGTVRNTIDYTHYDDGSGTLNTVTNNRYSCHWVYRHVDDGDVYVIYGTNDSLLSAAETAGEPSKPLHLDSFGLLIGKIIAPQAGGSFTTIQMVNDTIFTGTATSDHGQLSGLSDDDHTQYTLTDGTRQFTGAIDVDGNIVVSGNVDGRNVSTDGTKLDTIDENANNKTFISLPAESAYLPATNPASRDEALGSTTYAGWSYLAFDDTTSEHAVWRTPMPDYNGGNIIVTAYTKPATTPSGSVTLQFNILTIGLATSETFNSAVTVDTSVNLSQSMNTTELSTDIMITTATIDPSNVAADDLLIIELSRDVSSDNLVGDGQLIGIKLEYTRL